MMTPKAKRNFQLQVNLIAKTLSLLGMTRFDINKVAPAKEGMRRDRRTTELSLWSLFEFDPKLFDGKISSWPKVRVSSEAETEEIKEASLRTGDWMSQGLELAKAFGEATPGGFAAAKGFAHAPIGAVQFVAIGEMEGIFVRGVVYYSITWDRLMVRYSFLIRKDEFEFKPAKY